MIIVLLIALSIVLSSCDQSTQQTLTFDQNGILKTADQLRIHGENRKNKEQTL